MGLLGSYALKCSDPQGSRVLQAPGSSKVLGRLSGGIKFKILGEVDWSQVSNQPSQLESAAATKISRS